ncbi:hypothetical protein R1flu_020560 [Riccia fluitans]|uniref:Uncharacterized protein n=1 Tax=Riccia fluitans TaxID=41844 RepID=A0ABD1ZN11_9MARC
MKWLIPEDEKKLGFVRDEDEEAEDKEPSSPKADKVREEAEEVPQVETSAKVPEEDEPTTVDTVPDEEIPTSKWNQSEEEASEDEVHCVTLMDKPKARKKMKMTKKDTIDLSDKERQQMKREDKIVFAEGTLQVPETNVIENFKKSMTYSEQVVIHIL